jgi:hypothetical protein
MFLASMGISFSVHLLLAASANPDLRQGSRMIEGQSGAGGMENKAKKGGWTGLMWGAQSSHVGVVNQLLEVSARTARPPFAPFARPLASRVARWGCLLRSLCLAALAVLGCARCAWLHSLCLAALAVLAR